MKSVIDTTCAKAERWLQRVLMEFNSTSSAGHLTEKGHKFQMVIFYDKMKPMLLRSVLREHLMILMITWHVQADDD